MICVTLILPEVYGAWDRNLNLRGDIKVYMSPSGGCVQRNYLTSPDVMFQVDGCLLNQNCVLSVSLNLHDLKC